MNATDNQSGPAQILAGMVGEIVRRAGTRNLISGVFNDLMDGWGSTGGIRARVAPPVRWIVARVLHPGPDGKRTPLSSGMGRLLTSWAHRVNADHASDPICHAHGRGETIHDFLKSTDFGEIREMMEGAAPCTVRTVEAFNEQLWKYPAKVGSILATGLAMANTAIRCLTAFLKPIEQKVGPDLLADLVLSLLKGIDAREAAHLMNSVNEFIRRLHTGNLLLSKAGRPLLQVYLTALFKDAVPLVDSSLLAKSQTALAEDREALAHAVADALRDHPGPVLSMISAFGSRKNPLIRTFSRMTRLYGDIDTDAMARSVSQGLSDLDTYEISQAVNTLVRLINNLHGIRPEMFSSFFTSIADSLDAEEIRTALEWMVPEIIEAARPVVQSAVPVLQNALSFSGGEQ